MLSARMAYPHCGVQILRLSPQISVLAMWLPAARTVPAGHLSSRARRRPFFGAGWRHNGRSGEELLVGAVPAGHDAPSLRLLRASGHA